MPAHFGNDTLPLNGDFARLLFEPGRLSHPVEIKCGK